MLMPDQSQRLSQTEGPVLLKNVILRYQDWMKISDFSPETIHVRGLYLKYFASWCEERGIIDPREVTPSLLDRYQRYLFHYRKRDDKALSMWSRHGRLIGIRGLFRWLAKQRILLYNPASEIELPRMTARHLPRALTLVETEQVLAQPDLDTPVGLRDRALLEMFYSTGMRRKELVGLKRDDVDFTKGIVLIREGKGGKERVVPMGDRAGCWVQKYLEEVQPQWVREPDEGFIFITMTGKTFHPNHVSKLARDYMRAAGIEKVGACHLFRHTCATAMLEGGADIRYIQELLGHSRLTTTQIYTKVSIGKLKEVHSKTHPAAKMEKKTIAVPHEDQIKVGLETQPD